MFDASAQSVLAPELEIGERLLWAARPNPRRAFARLWFFLPFGGCFTGFALFWITGAALIGGVGHSAFNEPFIFRLFPLFGVPFVLVGLGIMAQPFLAQRNAQRGAYGITDRRAILVEGSGMSGARRVQSFGRREMQGIERRDLSDGSSDVIFARQRVHNSRNSNWNEVGFWGVPDGREAERLLRALQ